MNGTLLSLCLVGAALATANMLMMQRPTCSVRGTEMAAAGNTVQPWAKTELISKAKAEPANDQAKPLLPAKDVTGSVKQPTKTDQKQPSQPESKLRAKVAVAGSTKTARGDVDTGSVKQPKKADQNAAELRGAGAAARAFRQQTGLLRLRQRLLCVAEASPHHW